MSGYGAVYGAVYRADVRQPTITWFNIYKLAERKEKSPLLQRYTLSSELADYVSYPEDKDSLVYIAVPNSKFKLSDVRCSDLYISDHRALIATVD